MSFLSKLLDDKPGAPRPPAAAAAAPPARPPVVQPWTPTTPQSLVAVPGARRLQVRPMRPRTGAVHIPYDTHLVDRLDIEHQRLLALFTDISTSFAAGDVTHAAAGLRKFTSDIQAHLLTENIGLYVYLEDVLTDHDGQKSRSRVYNIHHAMDAIGQAVLDFLNKYRLLDKKPELQATFGADLAAIGAALVERIKLEETTLYPQYNATAPAQ